MATGTITAKQSRQARSLLKWNIQDVVNKCQLIRKRRLDHFERGIARLTRPENDALVKTYVDHGILFTKDYDVKLKKVDVEKQRTKLNEDVVEDVDEVRELSEGVEQKEKIDVDLETAKDIRERTSRLIDLKEEDDEVDVRRFNPQNPNTQIPPATD